MMAFPAGIDPFLRRRQASLPVRVGSLIIGGDHPIVVQSMATVPLADLEACLAQALRMIAAGCELLRLTVPTVEDARALAAIRGRLDAAGLRRIPLVADVHFQPQAALEAVEHVEKVRINPGNYADAQGGLGESEDDWRAGLARIRERFLPLARRSRQLGRALRIGVNHGSLSRRIRDRFGDTPEGMVHSAIEFITVAEEVGLRDLVVSLKSSKPRITVQAYRLLAQRLRERGTPYPLHLGVTEAGSGLEGRIKGAAGIGALLADGLGDTIRVSLTEAPEAELPVARAVIAACDRMQALSCADQALRGRCFPPARPRRGPVAVLAPGQVAGDAALEILAETCPDTIPGVHAFHLRPAWQGRSKLLLLDLEDRDPAALLRRRLAGLPGNALVGLGDLRIWPPVQAYRLLAAVLDEMGADHPLCLAYPAETDPLSLAAAVAGTALDGIGDALYCPAVEHPTATALIILQALGLRRERAEFIACPTCGRTSLDLVALAEEVKAATGHLKDLTIAVMGCIVNGPGEMAGADFGCLGCGRDRVVLYRGPEPLAGTVAAAAACAALVDLIKASGRWHAPP